MILNNFKNQAWFNKLNPTQKELLLLSQFLLEEAKNRPEQLFDYAYILMPAAKAYEGFIKDLIFRLNFEQILNIFFMKIKFFSLYEYGAFSMNL